MIFSDNNRSPSMCGLQPSKIFFSFNDIRSIHECFRLISKHFHAKSRSQRNCEQPQNGLRISVHGPRPHLASSAPLLPQFQIGSMPKQVEKTSHELQERIQRFKRSKHHRSHGCRRHRHGRVPHPGQSPADFEIAPVLQRHCPHQTPRCGWISMLSERL